MLKGSVQRSPFRSNAVQSQYWNNISPGTWYMAILFNLVILMNLVILVIIVNMVIFQVILDILVILMNIRARWISKLLKIKTGHMYSYVKLNFKASLFSCIFWFEAIFCCKTALLVFWPYSWENGTERAQKMEFSKIAFFGQFWSYFPTLTVKKLKVPIYQGIWPQTKKCKKTN